MSLFLIVVSIQLAKAIRQDNTIFFVRLIMMTPIGQQEEMTVWREAGIGCVVNKPIRQAILCNALTSVMKLTQENANRRSQLGPTQRFNAKVLVAEDNTVNQQVVCAHLKVLGCDVQVVANGVQAVEMTLAEHYDLVFMDWHMPEMDGMEATHAIRQREEESDMHVPIIALTANAMAGDRERCLTEGMDDYLSKPFRKKQLAELLERWAPYTLVELDEEEPRQKEAPPMKAVHQDEDAIILSGCLDSKALDEIRALNDSPSDNAFSEIISSYLTDAPQLLSEIELALSENDYKRVQIKAHTLKSSSASLGAHALSVLCKDLEYKGRHNETDNIAYLCSQIKAEYEQVKHALEYEMNRDYN